MSRPTIGSRQGDVRHLFKGLGFTGTVEPGPAGVRWLGQAASRKLAVEIEGEPVRRVSLSVPAAAGAGVIVGQFLNQFADQAAREWATSVLARFGDDPSSALDEAHDAGDVRVRLQSMLPLLVVTVEARTDG